ncbi:RDD family protein [Streptomyces sp. NRRL F-5135]|uniref:RDD family protein n=1 Tax=Streptomyces sp. NRRL F-5135 TaxID=1463858 RepID=UPI000691B497|nr:RDD family protein [Streptomyces sp. NRRL F-5135]
MSNDQPPPGEPPEDDPFLKRPRPPRQPDERPGPEGSPGGGPPPEPPGEAGPAGPAGPPGSSGPPGPEATPPEPPREPPPGPPPGSPYGSPYGAPYGGDHPPPASGPGPYGSGPYGSGAFGGGRYGEDPLAGMPPLAPFGKRFLARLIDALIIFIPLALISTFAGGGWTATPNSGSSGTWNDFSAQVNTGRQWLWSLISVVAFVGYDTLMTRKYGQTLGKRWLSLRTAMLNDGSVPDTGSSLVRALVLWVPALVCCFCVWWFIIIVSIAGSRPYRQGLHDKAARTVVVTTDQDQGQGREPRPGQGQDYGP